MKNTNQFIKVFYFLILSLTVSCSVNKEERETTTKKEETLLPKENNEVTVMPLRKQLFHHELVSNGKVVASQLADLHFESSQLITHIFVKNGDYVRKGQRLAELDKFELTNKRRQTKESLERAKLNLKDVLIGQGYATSKENEIPKEVLELAKVKSSYEQSRTQYELAKRAEEKATLVAPFDGVVANLFVKPYNQAHPSETFCSLMNTTKMEVCFSVLESELLLIHRGDKVMITPYANRNKSYEGYISEINPLVDSNGMVRVMALVKGQKDLFNGMNVSVKVQRVLKNCLVIPKTAVVLRSGKQVVFTLNHGLAKWNYVHVETENTTDCVVSNRALPRVSKGLVEGDTVIVSGSLNLAHEAPVVITKIHQ
jgi:RND family efflux transporter MFP subunit